jgi:hypothetical protein
VNTDVNSDRSIMESGEASNDKFTPVNSHKGRHSDALAVYPNCPALSVLMLIVIAGSLLD